MSTCSVVDCPGSVVARGWCWKHYQRHRRHGTTSDNVGHLPMPERFWAFVPDRPEGECWEWVGCKSQHGYGRFRTSEGKYTSAHRVAWDLLGNPLPDWDQTLPAGDRLTLDHTCHNRGCVNPDHLEVVTFRENLKRRRRAGRYPATKLEHPRCGAGTD